MNLHLLQLEYAVVALALAYLVLDLWLPAARRRPLGTVAGLALLGLLGYSFTLDASQPALAFTGGYLLDPLALYFKRFFLLAGALVLFMSVEYADRVETGLTEYYSLLLFALSGMMFAASAHNFAMLFVSLELITVTFYILVSFHRSRAAALEGGVKYLILGGLSTGILVFGMALVFGVSGTMQFDELAARAPELLQQPLFALGALMIFGGLAFKLAAFPFQFWAPDVYQAAPSPTAAFLAVGSKAAGVVLMLRLLFQALPGLAQQWTLLLMLMAGATIVYGNLCALPQQNLKRLFGYSSVAHAGYLLLGVTALNAAGASAVLFYLGGYLFTVIAAFLVITLVLRQIGAEEIGGLAGLHQRSPLLAGGMTLAMVSLAGIPPLAGFFGKFLLLKSLLEKGDGAGAYLALVLVALFGVAVSLYYYFGVIRAMYWPRTTTDLSPITISMMPRLALYGCMAGMLALGVYPAPLIRAADAAVQVLKF